MNWQAKYLLLSVLIIPLLFSCRSKDGEITTGTNYSTIGTNYTDTLSLNTYTVLVNDSVATSTRVNYPDQTTTYISYLQVGQFTDAVTGNVRAEAYTQLRLETENVDLSGVTSVANIDSAFLYLDYQGYSYGDTMQSQELEIFEMTSALNKDGIYFSSSAAPSIGTSIGTTGNFNVKPHTRDANGSVIHKISIDHNWAYGILAQGGTTSDDFVATKLDGIAIIPQGAPAGAVIRINLSTGNTRLVIYHSEGSSYTLTMNTNGQGFSRIVSDRSATDYSGLSLKVSKPSTTTSDVTYMQAGVGVRTKVEIPHLSLFKEAVGHNVVINKALLLIPVAANSTDDLESSLGIYLIRTDQTNVPLRNSLGNLAYVQSVSRPQNGSGYDLFVAYDSTNKYYQADITDYVRDMLNERLPNEGFFISPNSFSVTVERTVLNSGSLSLTDRMQLKLYYTVKP